MINNCVAIFIILCIAYLMYNNNYEKFNNYIIHAEYQNPICGMTCCHKTWTSMDIDESDIGLYKTDMGTKYLPSGIMCDNGINTGCMCIPIPEPES
jgi:hypothetical protein